MTTSKFLRLKLLLLCSLYCYISEVQDVKPRISQVAEALLYHQFQVHQQQQQQAPPLIAARVSRQPITSNNQKNYHTSGASSSSSSSSSSGIGNNNYQAQQSFDRQQQQLTSHQTTRDSNEDFPDDVYGCPYECHCNRIAQIADCSNRNLSKVPSGFPKDIKRIRLERNNITEIGPYAFDGLERLQRVDLSNNNLMRIDTLAFSGGLRALNSLILYSNKLEYLPVNVFSELSQLQLLLLNANSLKSISKDLFQSLANLNLLSLYDNNLATIPSGTFFGLKNIKTIHLGKNPLVCDCNLRWLADYLELNPVETSEARCEGPSRAQGKKLSQLGKSEFKCQPQQFNDPDKVAQQAAATSAATTLASSQGGYEGPTNCPAGCVCNGITIDCSGAPANSRESPSGGGAFELPDIPDDVPVYVARVHINDNRIKRIRQTGLFRRLANSRKLDLGNNRIVDIEDNAINGQLAGKPDQKPERVVFVLLENQSCSASSERQPAATTASQDTQDAQARQAAPADACGAAPKVNEPHFDSACYNGGSCRVSASAAANYSCLCPPGFAGPLCEINLDDCADHQCQNGAMCVDGVNSYKCVCRDPTTSGEFCEQLNNVAWDQQQLPPPPPTSFSYATSSASSIVPLALPMIASSAPSQTGNELLRQEQPLASAADYSRAAPEAAHQSNQVPTASVAGGCQRVTTRQYFDDGNGCQSVRVLKLSSCSGACSADGAGATCCVPARVKRRRIRMQCNDGASYVKTVDLVKKCACASECSQQPQGVLSQRTQAAFADSNKRQDEEEREKFFLAKVANKKLHRPSFNATQDSQDEQPLQITRLDAVD